MSNLRSMTGFGAVEASNNNLSVKLEIRALNGKFFDLSPRISRLFRDKETEIRQWAANKIGRGSIQINIHAELTNNDLLANQLNINYKVAANYKRQIDQLIDSLGIQNPNLFEYIMQLPEVVKIEDQKTGDEDWIFLKENLEKTFLLFDNFRIQEGVALAKDLKNSTLLIQKSLNLIVEMDAERKEQVRTKITKGLAELHEKVQKDETRFEYELLYYLEKLDISEEVSRLSNHIDYFIETLEKDPTGKKLGFISQEMGREINTLGSKANYFPMQKHVVEMKEVLEKIKEQVLNVL